MNTRKLLYRLCTCVVVAIAAGLPCYAQGDERSLEKGSWRFEPVEVLGLKTKGQTREFGRKFMDEDDWLTGLTVVARNISDHPIARIEFELSFPRAEGREFVSFIVYGKDPAAPNAAYVRQVQPGETVDVQVHPVNVPAIQAKLLGLGYPPKVKRAQIRLSSVTFGDGTMWYGDLILSPDPQNPDRKINPREVTKPYPRKSRTQLSAIRGQDWASRRFHHMRFVSKNVLDAMSPSTPAFQGTCDKLFIRREQKHCNPPIIDETATHGKMAADTRSMT